MKGDFSRFTHRPAKHFTGVRKQQGRVDLDADFNEYVDIQDYLDRTAFTDVIGHSGVPKTGGGFTLELKDLNGPDLAISPGRIYVDGILCQLESGSPASYRNQPYYPTPDPPALNPKHGRVDLVYLDVWRRHITAVEDPDIREPALGGPDTTTRLQTIWQVKIAKNTKFGDCADVPRDWAPRRSGAQLTTSVNPSSQPDDPCVVGPEGGYRGLENRLYRVEIHTGGDLNQATFKWSRDNGSVLFAIDEFVSSAGTTDKIILKRLGRDEVLTLHKFDWVEVLGDKTDLHEDPGMLVQITDIRETGDGRYEVSLSGDVGAHAAEKHPKVRRWDQDSDAIPVSTSAMFLENGIDISFSGGPFLSGDYWVFAARTNTASIESLKKALPHNVDAHHYAPLAFVTWVVNKEEISAIIDSCLKPFPPLTELPTAGAGCCTISVGDGVHSTGDFTDIQSAVDAALQLETGVKVCILPGLYRLEKPVVIQDPNHTRLLSICGCGCLPIIEAPPDLSAFQVTQSMNIHFCSLQIISAAADPTVDVRTCKSITFEDCIIRNAGVGLGLHKEAEEEAVEHPANVVEGPILAAQPNAFARDYAMVADTMLTGTARLDITRRSVRAAEYRYERPATAEATAAEAAVMEEAVTEAAVLAAAGIREQPRAVRLAARGGLYGRATGYVSEVRYGPALSAMEAADLDITGCDLYGMPAVDLAVRTAEVVENEIEGSVWVHDGSRGVFIRKNMVHSAPGPGIILGGPVKDQEALDKLTGVSTVEITENLIYSTRGSGIATVASARPAREKSHAAMREAVFSGSVPPVFAAMVGVVNTTVDVERGDISDLVIAGNTITGCAAASSVHPLDFLFEREAVGGITLRDVSSARIEGNTITRNGRYSACGIFVAEGVQVEIAHNTVEDNGRMPLSVGQAAEQGFPALQGGIVGNIVSSQSLADAGKAGLRVGAPAARVHDNVVTCSVGPALVLTGLGAMSVTGNSLTSRDVRRKVEGEPEPLPIFGDCVSIYSVGRTQIAVSPVVGVLAMAALANVGVGTHLAEASLSVYFPDGRVMFHDNQVTLQQAADQPNHDKLKECRTVTIISFDDVSFEDNQILTDTTRFFVVTPNVVIAPTVRATGNRFTEFGRQTLISYGSLGELNIATANEATRCLMVLGSKVYQEGNLIVEPTFTLGNNRISCADLTQKRRDKADG